MKCGRPSFVLLETCFSGNATPQLLARIIRLQPAVSVAGFGAQPYSPRFIARFIVSGAELGYLNMRDGRNKFCYALEKIMRDVPYIPEDVGDVIDRYSLPVLNNYDLTEREIDIVLLISEGAEAAAIARSLEIAPKTVRNCISHIYIKWNVSNPVQVVKRAIREGIINKDEFCDADSHETIIMDNGEGGKYVCKM
jgi:DNA-binding NarL/FixJ family response regulator